MPTKHEDALKAPVGKFLRASGYEVAYEVKVGGREIDALGWNPRKLVAVELKINKWLNGLRQASFYQGWSDHVYLALPSERLRPALANRELFESSGIGLLAIERRICKEVIPSRKNKTTGSLDRKAVMADLRSAT